jgi:hypothetical protein
MLGILRKLDHLGAAIPLLYCVAKNVETSLLDAEEPWSAVAQRRLHRSPGRGLTEGATNQNQRQALCWSDLLGRSGNAA